jgi:protein tyrosine/serine phosphatase
MKYNVLQFCVAVMIAMAASVTAVSAQESPAPEFPNVKIGNFGKMDDRFYRGAQPEKDDYPALAALGVKTVIDLRNDPTDYEKGAVEALGMKYVNIPMSGWKYANDKDVEKFMSLLNDPSTGTVYVHCKAGKHRTGLVGAVYRLNQYGWGYDQAYKEMKKYNYTSWPVHFNIKAYVKNYFEKNEKSRAAAATGVAMPVTRAAATSN